MSLSIICRVNDESRATSRGGGNPDLRQLLLCVCTVAAFMKDEVLNNVDDNMNGITDETGLSFVVDGDSVTIRLTLERMNKEGNPVRVSKETTVTCRN